MLSKMNDVEKLLKFYAQMIIVLFEPNYTLQSEFQKVNKDQQGWKRVNVIFLVLKSNPGPA